MAATMRYSEVFYEYASRVNRDFKSFDEYQEVITADTQPTKVIKELSTTEFDSKSAIIVLGFSGNGKTTLMNEIVKKHPNFMIASMDTAEREFMIAKVPYTKADVLDNFGRQIELASNKKQNIVLDGFFVNLATRMVLISFLRKLGYTIYLIDLTPYIEERLFFRADDVTVFRYHIKGMSHFTHAFRIYASMYSDYDESEIRNYLRSTQGWKEVKEEIDAFLLDEKKRGYYEEQVLRDSFSIGIDAFLV